MTQEEISGLITTHRMIISSPRTKYKRKKINKQFFGQAVNIVKACSLDASQKN